MVAVHGALANLKMLGVMQRHMVQNQMTPSYPQFPQTGLPEEYQQTPAATPTQAAPGPVVTDPAQIQTAFKDGPPPFSQATAVTPNGVDTQTTELESESPTSQSGSSSVNTGPKRLHVSNIPFRFREADLRQLLGFGPILDVEIIFNERGSKGFGFVTFQNSADADRAREKLNGTVVEGRKIEVNNATARVMTKKATAPTALPAGYEDSYLQKLWLSQTESGCVGQPDNQLLRALGQSPMGNRSVINVADLTMPAAALRGVAFARGRVRGAVPAGSLAAFRHPTPLAQPTATGLPYTAGVYAQDPFLATAYAERYQPYAAGYAAAATRYAIPTVATAATYAAAAGPGIISSYGREYAADPYLGHSIGPVPGYGVSAAANLSQVAAYRGGYQRFTPY